MPQEAAGKNKAEWAVHLYKLSVQTPKIDRTIVVDNNNFQDSQVLKNVICFPDLVASTTFLNKTLEVTINRYDRLAKANVTKLIKAGTYKGDKVKHRPTTALETKVKMYLSIVTRVVSVNGILSRPFLVSFRKSSVKFPYVYQQTSRKTDTLKPLVQSGILNSGKTPQRVESSVVEERNRWPPFSIQVSNFNSLKSSKFHLSPMLKTFFVRKLRILVIS